MLKFVKTAAINDAMDAVRTLSKYNGMDIELRIGGLTIPVTFLRSSATGNSQQDELSIEFVWRMEDPDGLANTYNSLRKQINRKQPIRVGRDEFAGTLTDTTKLPANASISDYKDARFDLAISNVHSGNKVTAAQHSTACVMLTVPDFVCRALKEIPGVAQDQDFHITLCYLTEVGEEEPLMEACKKIAHSFGSIQVEVKTLKISGAATFPTEQDDGTWPQVALVHSPQLMKMQAALADALDAAQPNVVSRKFAYQPHITLAYVKDRYAPLPRIQPIVWRADQFYYSDKKENCTHYMLDGIAHLRRTQEQNQRGGDRTIVHTADGVYTTKPPYLQWENHRARFKIIKQSRNSMTIQSTGTPRETDVISSNIAGVPITMVTKDGYRRLMVDKVSKHGDNTFTLTFRVEGDIKGPVEQMASAERLAIALRSLGYKHDAQMFLATVPGTQGFDPAATLLEVADELDTRGQDAIAQRVRELASEVPGEGESSDVEALGPGAPGTLPQICTYTKGPQTQLISTDAPSAPKAIDFTERNYAGKKITPTQAKALYNATRKHYKNSYAQMVEDVYKGAKPLAKKYGIECYMDSPWLKMLSGFIRAHRSWEELGEQQAELINLMETS